MRVAAGDINIVMLAGNVAADPKMGTTQNGVAKATFDIATNMQVKDAAGNYVDGDANWTKVTAYGNAATKIVGPYLRKGMRVTVTGRLEKYTYEEMKIKDLINNSILPDVSQMWGGGQAGAVAANAVSSILAKHNWVMKVTVSHIIMDDLSLPNKARSENAYAAPEVPAPQATQTMPLPQVPNPPVQGQAQPAPQVPNPPAQGQQGSPYLVSGV